MSLLSEFLDDAYMVDYMLKEAIKNALSTDFYSYRISGIYAME